MAARVRGAGVLITVLGLALPVGVAALPSLLAYEAALLIVVAALWWGLRPVGFTAVTDLVVELGGNRSGPVRDALADLLGDPTARLGYWHAAQAAYVDHLGEPLGEPAAGAAQTLTRIDRDGRRFAALLHDSAVGVDRTVAQAVAAADRLMSAHAALQADIRARVAEVSGSRRRLQRAVDGERQRLERRLAAAAESRLVAMLGDLRGIRSEGDVHLSRAVDQLERTLIDLHDAARGLFPGEPADGLSSAVAAISSRCPVPVTLSVSPGRFDPEIETAAYYLCAEALTNVAKHARASAVRIDVTARPSVLLLTIADDGVGGADPRAVPAYRLTVAAVLHRLVGGGGHDLDTPVAGGGRGVAQQAALALVEGGEPLAVDDHRVDLREQGDVAGRDDRFPLRALDLLER